MTEMKTKHTINEGTGNLVNLDEEITKDTKTVITIP